MTFAFVSNDATLVEINPLVVTPEGLVALDSKMVLDDKAVVRQSELFESIGTENKSLPGMKSEETKDDTVTYVPLDSGSVGLISDGAGKGMLTLDLIRDEGGEAACFCEMGGLTSPQVMYDAMEMVLKDPKVKSLLVKSFVRAMAFAQASALKTSLKYLMKLIKKVSA